MPLQPLTSLAVSGVLCVFGGVIIGSRGARPWAVPAGLCLFSVALYMMANEALTLAPTLREYKLWSEVSWAPAPMAVFFMWIAGALAVMERGTALLRKRSTYLVFGLTGGVASLGTLDSLYAYEAIGVGDPGSVTYTAIPTSLYSTMVALTAGGTLHATLNARRAWVSSGSGADRDLFIAFCGLFLIGTLATFNFFLQMGVSEPYLLALILGPGAWAVKAARRGDGVTSAAALAGTEHRRGITADVLFRVLDPALKQWGGAKSPTWHAFMPLVDLRMRLVERTVAELVARTGGEREADGLIQCQAAWNVIRIGMDSMKPRGPLDSGIGRALNDLSQKWPAGSTVPADAAEYFVLVSLYVYRRRMEDIAHSLGMSERTAYIVRRRAIRTLAARLSTLEREFSAV